MKFGSRHSAFKILLSVLAPLLAAREAHAMRLVSLAPSVTETLFALGAGAEVVGVSAYCDYPPEATRIDRVGTFLTPNVEAIVAKRPDLVIAVPSPGNRDSVGTLEGVGLSVLVVDPQTVQDIKMAIARMATAIGRPEAGRDLIRRIEERMGVTLRRLRGAEARNVLIIVGHTPLIAVGSGVFQDELIRLAGGVNLAAAAGGQWPHLSLEFVLAGAPEVIVDTTMGNEDRPGTEGAGEFWGAFQTLPAVRTQRVFGYREDVLLRPGPRLHEGLDVLARFIHPERFVDTRRDE